MRKRFAQWIWPNLGFALFPLLCEIGFRWFGHGVSVWAVENIPEITFVVGILCLSASSDISSIVEVVKGDKEAAGIIHYQGLLFFGALLATALFGGYTAISSYKHIVEEWQPRMVPVAWIVAVVFSGIAIKAERVALKVITK